MDNGSLKPRASVHKDRQQCKEMEGGGGIATITTSAISSWQGQWAGGWGRGGGNPVFCTQTVTVSC